MSDSSKEQQSASDRTIDVLLLTALKDEFDALCASGAPHVSQWRRISTTSGHFVYGATLQTVNGEVQLAATWATDMGTTEAGQLAIQLVDEYRPRLVAMCGICAGRRGKVGQGDVIFARQVWNFERGKVVVDYDQDGAARPRFAADMSSYQLRHFWVHPIQHLVSFFSSDTGRELPSGDGPEPNELKQWLRLRPPSFLSQERWLLDQLLDHEASGPPLDCPPDGWKEECPDWKDVVVRLRHRGALTRTGLELTTKGELEATDQRLLHPEGLPPDAPFQVHLAPVGTGSRVIEDEKIFEWLSQSMRKVLGLEMEASAIAHVAHRAGVDVLIAKGVSDFADSNKDDRFRYFASRASAEMLLHVIRTYIPTREEQQGDSAESRQQVRSHDPKLPSVMHVTLQTDESVPPFGDLVRDVVQPQGRAKPTARFHAFEATSLDTLMLRAAETKPTILQIDGHSNRHGVLVGSRFGSGIVSWPVFVDCIRRSAADVEVVVLGQSNSDQGAIHLAAWVPVVVGYEGLLHNAELIAFIDVFYPRLMGGSTIREAFDLAEGSATAAKESGGLTHSGCFVIHMKSKGCLDTRPMASMADNPPQD